MAPFLVNGVTQMFTLVEKAIPMMLELAEANALRPEEIRGDEEILSKIFEQQREDFEVVQDYIDSDFGANMTHYTKERIGLALSAVLALGSDNILDEDLCDDDDTLLEQRERQIEASNVVEDHIVNHLGE